MPDSANDNERAETPASPPRCPICQRPAEPAYRPFCSKRCADVDLARWLGGRYVIPADPDDDQEGDATPENR